MLKITVTDTKNLEAAFEKYGVEAVKEFKEITKIRAKEIEIEAKLLAPVNKQKHGGTLRQNIRTTVIPDRKGLGWTVGAYMPYSAYHEFGTGGNVNIPVGWEEMAAQFKGRGVKQVNIKARPFMYPAFVKGSKLYQKDIKHSLKELAKKFNNG